MTKRHRLAARRLRQSRSTNQPRWLLGADKTGRKRFYDGELKLVAQFGKKEIRLDV